MTTFIHISDLHVHSTQEPFNIDTDNAISEIIEYYKYFKIMPTVLLTGDITDGGKEDQYDHAVEKLVRLKDAGFELLPCPGNHDYGPKGNIYEEKCKKRYRDYIIGALLGEDVSGKTLEDFYPRVTEKENAVFIGLDSVVGNYGKHYLHFACGEIGREQREKLGSLIDKYSDKKKSIIVYFHHHPFSRNFTMALDDKGPLLDILHGRIDFLCFGHRHISEVWMGKYDIDWILASGRTCDEDEQRMCQFREVTIDESGYLLRMIKFPSVQYC